MLSDSEMQATPSSEVDFVLADPPWRYKSTLAGMHLPYPTLSTPEIIQRRPNLAEDAIVLLWTTSTHMPDAMEILRAWGLIYVGITFVWNKTRPIPGWYTMPQCEFCIMGKRGKPGRVWNGYSGAKQFIEEPATTHSRKPSVVQDLLDTKLLHPHVRRLEMYARGPRIGWMSWGNEIPGWCVYTPAIEPIPELMNCTDTTDEQTEKGCTAPAPSNSLLPPPRALSE